MSKTAQQFPVTLPSPVADSYISNTSQHADDCYICGRGLSPSAIKRGAWVERSVCGLIINQKRRSEFEGESQGLFAVGSTCKKRIPKPFRANPDFE